MIKFNAPKAYSFAIVVGYLLATVYLLLYINGFFGDPIFGIEMFHYILLETFNPVHWISGGIVLAIGYRHFKERYIIHYNNLRKFVLYYSLFIGVLTVGLLGLYIYEKTFLDYLAFFYIFFVGLGFGLYFGMKIFRYKNEINNSEITNN